MAAKMYPFSVGKNAHNIMLVKNIGINTGNAELEMAACHIEEQIFMPQNGIIWLSGPDIGLAKQLVMFAEEYRFEANQKPILGDRWVP